MLCSPAQEGSSLAIEEPEVGLFRHFDLNCSGLKAKSILLLKTVFNYAIPTFFKISFPILGNCTI